MLMPDKVFKHRISTMAGRMNNRNCQRQVQSKEFPRKSLDIDPVENILLTLVRFFAESFAMPQTQSWVRSINYATQHFGADEGAVIAQRLLLVLLVMQKNKPSGFNFSAPSCKICSEIVTEDERRFMAAIKSVRKGNSSQTIIELMFLCEGQDTGRLTDCIKKLCAVLPSGTSIRTTKHMEQ